MPFIKKGSPESNAKALASVIADKAGEVASEATLREAISAPNPVLRGSPPFKGRDFDAEARGKTRCALEEAWAQSPLLPMLVADPSDLTALHALLDNIVTERMKRVFPNG